MFLSLTSKNVIDKTRATQPHRIKSQISNRKAPKPRCAVGTCDQRKGNASSEHWPAACVDQRVDGLT